MGQSVQSWLDFRRIPQLRQAQVKHSQRARMFHEMCDLSLKTMDVLSMGAYEEKVSDARGPMQRLRDVTSRILASWYAEGSKLSLRKT